MILRLARISVALALACAGTSVHALPSYAEVRADHRPSDRLLLDRDGEVLHRLRTDSNVRRGAWVPLADMSAALRLAIVVSEDKRFHQHSGVDWRAVSAAAWGNLWNTRTRGASTLTMQLAGLVDEDWRRAPGGRQPLQKLGQAVAAQVLDRRWRKSEILEAYLNLVPFRGELVGVDALSRTLFDKAPHGLDEREAAVAAALVRGPNATPAVVARRACAVLTDMQPAGVKADCADLDVFTAAALQRRAFEPSEGIAPHLARRLLRGDGEPAVRSTLRADVQRVAVRALQQHLAELKGRNVADGAVVVLDNASGDVLAWVGSSGTTSLAAEVDGAMAPRQPGSTLKPFLYAQAIAEKRLTAASLLDDSPAQLSTAAGLYIPQNYDRQFKGWVSARTALGASLNVPAVRTLVMVSPDAFARQLRALGLPLKEGGDYYGFSLALGSAEVPLLALTNAYRALANGGQHGGVRMRSTDGPMAKQRALDAAAAFITTDILADPMARARTFGTDSLLATRFWTAVKTGTSKDMRDNWALGYSERYTVGVWVGNAAGAPMHDVSGTSGAAPVWATVMQHLHRQQPSRAPRPPAGLVRAGIRYAEALEASREEWFLPGTEQAQWAAAGNDGPATARRVAAAAGHRIVSPTSGTVIALDPDIPPARQRLQLTADGPAVQWRVNGKPLARGREAAWMPWPGRHRIQLADASGVVRDEVLVEVRGASVKQRR